MENIRKNKSNMSRKSLEIQTFLLEGIAGGHKKDIVTFAAKELGLSRQAIYLRIKKLVEEKQVVATGKTKSRVYDLQQTVTDKTLRITTELEEHIIWEQEIQPHLPELKENIFQICFHGFTEIFNNVKDHSEGRCCRLTIVLTPLSITLGIDDDGVGIFNKLKREFAFDDEHQAALELAKGKLTTDEQRHSGEGIFFTSRMFDLFSIYSRGFVFMHEENDWIVKTEAATTTIGTAVRMTISLKSARTTRSIFDQFATSEDEGFIRTLVPVKLAKYSDTNLISRSQAKRVLARLERFQVVILDFKDVEIIGQAFADEVFRVFNLVHPDVQFSVIHANKRIKKIIAHVISESSQQQMFDI